MRSKDRKIMLSLLATEEKSSISQIVNCENFCPTNRLFRVTAYVLRFVDRLKKSRKSNDTLQVAATLSAQEISHAENLWIKEAQRQLVGD